MFIKPRPFKLSQLLCRHAGVILGCLSTFLIVGTISVIYPASALSGVSHALFAQAPGLIIDKQVSNSTPEPGEKFTYLLRYRCASVEEHCTNAQITDAIPEPLTIVNYTRVGGNIVNVEANGNALTWDLETALDTPGQLSSGSSGTLTVDARFPACSAPNVVYPAAGTVISNSATFTADNATAATSMAGGADVTMPALDPCPVPEEELEEGFRKTNWDEIFANPGNPRVTYEIFLVDSAVPYVVEDVFPEGTTLESVLLSNLADAGGAVELRCAGVWHDLTPTLSGKLNNAQDVPEACETTQALGTTTAYWFTNADAIRFTTPANFDADEATPIDLIFLLDLAHPVGTTLRNTATLYEPAGVDLTGDDIAGDTVDFHADKLVVEPSMMGSIEVDTFVLPGYLDDEEVSLLDGNQNLPESLPADNTNHNDLDLSTVYLAKNDIVWKYRAQMRNDATIGLNWVNPVMVVDLPAEMEFSMDPETGNFIQVGLPDKSTVTAEYDPHNSDNCLTPEVKTIDDYNGDGRVRVRMDFPGCTIYGGMQQYAGIALYFSSRLKPDTPADAELAIDFRMYDENGLMFRCFGNDTNYKNWCGTTRTVSMASLPSESFTTLESFVFAKGTLDAEYHRFPQLGYTGSEAEIDYEAHIVNTGSVSHRYVDLVNVLPHVGDTGVTLSADRNSSWSQELRDQIVVERLDEITGEYTPVPAEEITRGPYYSSFTNPCRLGAGSQELYVDNDLAMLPSGCTPNAWGPSTPEAIGMRSVGLRWTPAEGFEPSEEVRIRIPTQQLTADTNACFAFDEPFGTGKGRADLAPTITTALTFDSAGAVDAGGYAILSSLIGTEDENGNKWHDITADITEDDDDGRMMIMNASDIVGELYRRTISGLTPGTDYSLSFSLANARNGVSADPSSLSVAIEPTGGGTPLLAEATPLIQSSDTLDWNSYQFEFTATAASVDLVLSITE